MNETVAVALIGARSAVTGAGIAVLGGVTSARMVRRAAGEQRSVDKKRRQKDRAHEMELADRARTSANQEAWRERRLAAHAEFLREMRVVLLDVLRWLLRAEASLMKGRQPLPERAYSPSALDASYAQVLLLARAETVVSAKRAHGILTETIQFEMALGKGALKSQQSIEEVHAFRAEVRARFSEYETAARLELGTLNA